MKKSTESRHPVHFPTKSRVCTTSSFQCKLTATTGPARTILTVVAAPRAAEHLSKLSYFSKYFKPPK
eukprot:m.225364 g.225364  ORF g.225364 m.225364 type:complete len:67 (+) comp33460_c0_seq8:258-458(+)